jgi:hypothetical protein
VIALALLALGFRHFVWAPPAAVGELLPYPERATALWRSYLSPWQPGGLGYPGPTSPAVFLLGAVPPLAFGAAGAAQKLLIAGLGAFAFVGGGRLVAEVADRPARFVAGSLYLLGAVGYAGMRSGALAGLAFGAAAPFALRALLSATGWSRPPGWDAGRGAARVAVAAALCGAFVPGAVVLLAGVAALLAGLRLVVGPRRPALAGLGVSALGLGGAWALLLPWSAGWAAPGGVLAELTGPGWRAHAAAFADHGMLTVLLGRTPEGPALVGAGMAVLAVVALVLASGQRRRLALALAAVVVAFGWLVSATAAGTIRPLVAQPIEAGVLSSAAMAGLGGLALAAFRLDLPRRRLGWMHALALLAIGGAGSCIALGIVPALWRAEWTPGRGLPGAAPAEVAELRSLITAEAEGTGGDAFRVLWVGPRYVQASPGSALITASHAVTGPDGRTLADLFAPPRQAGSADLEASVDSISSGATDVGGHLLGAFNVRLVVLDRAVSRAAWLGQRDLAVVRSERSFVLLRNSAALPRAGLFDELPGYVAALAARDPTLAALPAESPRLSAERVSASRYEASDADGPGVVWLAESAARRWEARIGDRPLEPVDGGWGNAFAAPAGAAGELAVSYPRTAADVLGPVALALAWIVALGAAASRGPVA